MCNLDLVSREALACERRRIFSVTGSAENNVCEPEPENDFCNLTTFVFSLANHIAWQNETRVLLAATRVAVK